MDVQQPFLRPKSVNRALIVMCLNLFVGAVVFFFGLSASTLSRDDMAVISIFGLVILCVMGLFVYQIARGKNWARSTYAILIGASLASDTGSMFEEIAQCTVSGIVTIVEFVLIGFVLYNLFCSEANQWFMNMSIKKPKEES